MAASEDMIRDLLMEVLYTAFGLNGSRRGEGARASFKIARDPVVGVCEAEAKLKYKLPNGEELSHKSDILVTLNQTPTQDQQPKYISIEIKHLSAVTDQFKCRSYDILHLKQTFDAHFTGVMVFVRAGQGVSIAQAKKICYPFDHFFGIDFNRIQEPDVFSEFAATINKEIGNVTGLGATTVSIS